MPYVRSEMNDIYNEVNACCSRSALSADCSVRASEVRATRNKLKPNKSNGSIGLSLNHILHNVSDLMVHLPCLFFEHNDSWCCSTQFLSK